MQLTMVAMMMMVMMMCLHISAVTTQQSTEAESYISRDEVGMMIRAACRQEETDQRVADAIGGLTEKLERLKLENIAIKEDNVALKQDNVAMKEDNVAMKEDNVAMKEEIVGLKQQIDYLVVSPPRHDDDEDQVAFHVVSEQNFGPVEEQTNVPYEIVFLNIGAGWSPVSNAFQAPVTGVYVFTANMWSDTSSTGNVICRLMHSHAAGQTIMGSMLGRSDRSADGSTIIVEMEQGDYFSIQLTTSNNGVLYSSGGRNSTFSGFLLFK